MLMHIYIYVCIYAHTHTDANAHTHTNALTDSKNKQCNVALCGATQLYIWVARNESCHTYVSYMSESWHTYEWVMTHICLSHDTHMNESYRTYAWVMSHICIYEWQRQGLLIHVTRLNTWQIPLKILPPRCAHNPENQIPQYKFK